MASGMIVPDLPLEEQGPIREALGRRGLALIPLFAPTTPAERRARICADAEGLSISSRRFGDGRA